MRNNCRHQLRRATCLAIAALSIVAACHRRPPVATLPPAQPTMAAELPVVAPPVEPVAPPPPVSLPPPASTTASADGRPDDALFQLGLLYAMDGPSHDWQRATTYLRQLVTNFPLSPLKPAADLILSLYGEVTQLTTDSERRDQRIRQLTTELERLKQIDAERRRRP